MSNIDQPNDPSLTNPNDPNAPRPSDAPPPPPAPKRKKRRWLKVLGVLVVLILALVVCAPWLAGTAPVRNIVVSQINKNINGTVAIDDYSVGWTGGIKANGIKVYDAQKNLMLSVPRVSTQLSLLGAMRGDLNLGDTVVDVRLDKIVVDENGNVNLAQLAKPQGAGDQPKPTNPAPAKTDDKEDEIDVPNIKGKLTVNVLGGSVEGAGVPAPIAIDPSTIVLNIPDINQPITNDIKLAYRVGNAKPSAISVNGSVDAVENGEIDLAKIKDTLKAQQKIALQDVDLSAASAVVKDATIGGIVNGALDVNAQGITGISANGEFIATNVAYAGAALPDRIALDRVSIPIQVTRTQIDANNALIKIERLGVDSSLVKLNVVGQVQEVALNNLAAKQKPGGDGQINIDLSVPDFGAVARALPNTLKLQEGVTIDSGSLTNSQSITITPENVTATQKLDLVAQGKRNNQPIRISPVHLETAATIVPTGKDMPDIRKLNLALQSAFATITGGGDSIAKIGIDGNFDLAKLQNELAQFVDLGGKQFAGTGQFRVETNGDVTQDAAPITASINANLANVRAIGVSEQPIDISRAVLVAGGELQRDTSGKPTALNNGTVTFQSGDEKAPLVDVAANANIGLGDTITAPSFKLAKFSVNNLADVQRQYGALVPALKQQGIELRSGAIYANVAGSFDGKTVTLSEPLAFSMPNIVVNKNGQQVFGREDISGKIAGTVTLGDAETKANLTELSIGAKSELFRLASDGPVNATLAKSGGVAGNGIIRIGADLARASNIAQAFGGNVQTSSRVASGKLDGTLKLAQAQDTTINFDSKVVNLTVETNGQQAIKNESVTITLDATATGDMKGVNLRTANIASNFANAKVSDGSIVLGGAPLEMVRKANVDVDVPNLPAVYGLMNAFAPPEAAKPQAAGQSITPPTLLLAMQRQEENLIAEKPLDPLALTSGSARVKLTVDRPQGATATNVNLSEMRVTKLELARGGKRYAFERDIDLKLASSISSKGEAIESLTVNELAGDLGGVATIAMPEKINITSPQDKPQANGAIKLDGTIDALVPLLAVLQGAEPLPYSGTYSLTQKIATVQSKDGQVINLEGTVLAPQFRMMENGRPTFEDSLEIKNNLGAYVDTKTATIRTLNVTMPKSNALALTVGGRVIDWEEKRTIRDAKVDLAYDLATLWKIVFPMLSPEMREQYKDMKVAGKASRTFNLGGAFPNRPTVYESFKSLTADGGFAVELLDLPQGITAQMIDLVFKIDKGVLVTQAGNVGERPPLPEDTHDGKANGPGLAGILGGGGGGGNRRQATGDERISRDAPPRDSGRDGTREKAPLKPESGYANTGALNLAGITVDLTTPHLNVTIPKDKMLLQNVRLNPVLADSLGKTGAVLLVGSSTAEGLVNLRVADFNRVPIGDLTARDRHANATLVLSVDDVKLSGVVTSALAMALGADAITGRIPDSTIRIANGQATTDLTVQIDKEVEDPKTGKRVLQGQPMKFTGGVTLADLRLNNFMVDIAPGLIVRDIRKYFPNGLSIPMRGFANKPQVDIQKAIAENAAKGLIPGLGGDKGGGGGGGAPTLDDILKGIGGKKDDKKNDPPPDKKKKR